MSNTWENYVPQRFLSIVFAAAQGKLFSINQAKALCDLFQAKYDFVLSAWEVFTIQGDVGDLVDTLLRIVRDIKVDPAKSSPGSNKVSLSKNETEKSQFNTQKEAMEAVSNAKRELLKHSLDMLIKQGYTTVDRSNVLLDRAVKGDALIEAAIEQYSGDRNIAEFLETLTILANNTPESLELLMKGINPYENNDNSESEDDDDDDDEEEDGEEGEIN